MKNLLAIALLFVLAISTTFAAPNNPEQSADAKITVNVILPLVLTPATTQTREVDVVVGKTQAITDFLQFNLAGQADYDITVAYTVNAAAPTGTFENANYKFTYTDEVPTVLDGSGDANLKIKDMEVEGKANALGEIITIAVTASYNL